jgi:hypothetical protein
MFFENEIIKNVLIWDEMQKKIWHKIWTNFPLCEFCPFLSAEGTKMHNDLYAFSAVRSSEFVQFFVFSTLKVGNIRT